MTQAWDQDALNAGLHLIERTGAQGVEIGYLHEGVPSDKAGWYCFARYHGARITAEDHPGPVEAVEALARRLLDGGTCTFCGQKIALGDYPGRRCRWTRHGDEWVRGCVATHAERNPKIAEAGRLQARGPQRRKGPQG